MQIAIAIDSPGFGGSERDLLRMLRTVKVSHQVDFLVTPQANPDFLESLKQLGEVHICRWAGNAGKHVLAGIFEATKCMLRFRMHYFFVWSHHCDSNRWLRLCLAISGREFAIAERAVAPDTSSLANSRLTAPLIRFISGRADQHLFCGRGQMEGFKQAFKFNKQNCKLIPNSRPAASIHSCASQLKSHSSEIKRNFQIPKGKLLICVGRLEKNKGQNFLISALAELQENVNLLLLGEGPAKQEFEELGVMLASGRVRIMCSNDPIPFLAAADIFVFPTLAEGLSGALIEAMAAGLPCVTTDISGNRELVQHGETGLLVPPSNSSALAAALRNLLENPAEARRLGEAGYTHVLKNYDQEIEVRLWKELFEGIIRVSKAK
jgi:glycosyltransferase involved in cell wall biosynthesis